MNLIDFLEKFPEDSSCRKKYKEVWDQEGVICRKC
jgi:hypothetical protein